MKPQQAMDPLAELHPLMPPPPPSWWPPAPGWWLLGLALFALLAAAIWWWRRRRRLRAPLEQALQLLRHLESLPDPATQVVELNRLLRRAARQCHGAEAAALAPGAWGDFLAGTAPAELRQRPWRELAEWPYRPEAPRRSGEYLALGRSWLRHNLTC